MMHPTKRAAWCRADDVTLQMRMEARSTVPYKIALGRPVGPLARSLSMSCVQAYFEVINPHLVL